MKEKKAVKTLNLRVDPAVYLKLKVHCVKSEISMQDFVVNLINNELYDFYRDEEGCR